MATSDGAVSEVQPPSPQDLELKLELKRKKKKEKLRSAWISFVGRIVAQILGAVTAITLGVVVADRIRGERATAAATPATVSHEQATLARPVPPDPRTSVVVLPLEVFSADPSQQQLADILTEELIAALGGMPELRVVSRTSSMQSRRHPRTVPEIAVALGVEIVVEGCAIRDGDEVRITVRAMDGARDTRLGSSTQRGKARGPRAHEDLASAVARDVAAIITASARPE